MIFSYTPKLVPSPIVIRQASSSPGESRCRDLQPNIISMIAHIINLHEAIPLGARALQGSGGVL